VNLAHPESAPRRVALVTGGSRGIGLACAEALAAAGHLVAVTYRSTKPALAGPELAGPELAGPATLSDRAGQARGSLYPVRCDVTSPSDVDEAFAEVEEHCGKVSILVCAAGITDDTLLLRMSEERWAATIETNLTGVYRTARRAVGPMVRARFGRIILISSVVAYLGSPGQTNYAASKAGLIGFGRSLAREVATKAITVNIVTPGVIATDMISALPPERTAALTSQVPLRRSGAPAEVAAAVRFLSSDEASYVTGAVLAVDGGLGMGQ
jgi:3-oxoacyl-[acyl-carrier protein] reductase